MYSREDYIDPEAVARMERERIAKAASGGGPSKSAAPLGALALANCWGLPLHLRQTYQLCFRELERQQGMVDDLRAHAEASYGLEPEDCDALCYHVRSRDHLKAVVAGLVAYFGEHP